MGEVLHVTRDTLLRGTFDPEARFALFTPAYTMKGLFFPRLVEMLGDGWDVLAPTLKQPPRDRRYLAFKDYPQVDYSRLTWAVARRCFPNLGPREAARRVAHRDIEVYGASRLGGITLALLGDPRRVLVELPRVMKLVLEGGTVVADERGPKHVRLDYRRFYGWVDCYVIGTLEGIVMHYGKQPRIDVALRGEGEASYDVRWE